jgi:kumamolisin
LVKHALWLMLAESHLTFAPSSYAELSKMYSSPFGFTDITGGSCGEYAAFLATSGWDFCTGLGSPRGYFGK